MANPDIIIVGAGAAGIVAARELSKNGFRVTIIEARDRIGGRVHTFHDASFSAPVELGSEFIHGRLPCTFSLLKDYGIPHHPAKGNILRMAEGKFEQEKDFVDDHHRELEKKLKTLKEDIAIEDFLNRYFISEKYNDLRMSVRKFVEGYDTADTHRASTFAFREEWLDAEDWEQYRPEGGYGTLMQALADDAMKHGCTIHLSEIVKEVKWKNGQAVVRTASGKQFYASKVIITAPLGVLMSAPESKSFISFLPALPDDKLAALRSLGFGSVIKIVMQFSTLFWESKALEKQSDTKLKDLFFLFSDATIPTWWTQAPAEIPLLTGWLGGTRAQKMRAANEETIVQEAMRSLTTIFGKEAAQTLTAVKVANWTHDPFSYGSYSFATVGAEKHIKTMKKPVEQTIFFAGEAYSSKATGTVEAALESGVDTAKNILLMQLNND